MKKLSRGLAMLLVLCMVLAMLPSVFAEEEKAEFAFVVTSDLHGQIYATDYTVDQAQSGTYKRGLTRVATYIGEMREKYGDDLFVADLGDTIQGAPLTYYYAFQKPEEDDPAIKALRTIGYDMWVVGNHEFNYGLKILQRQLDYAVSASTETEKQLSVCMANYLDVKTNGDKEKDWKTWNGYAPYVIKEMDGVKVAIIGFGNPNVPKWDIPANWEGIYFADIIETYKHYEPEMLEKADMIVVMAHSGIGSDEGSDFMERLVQETNSIACVFSGHEHGNQVTEVANKDGKTVPILQPYTKARAVAQVAVSYNKTTGEATLTPEVKNMENYALDEKLVEILKPYEETVWNEYMSIKIGEATDDYPAANLGTAPSAFMDLINTVQIWGAYDNTGLNTPDDKDDDKPAQLSISAPLTSGDNANIIDKGDIFLGDMFKLYRFENWFYQITMSGEEVHQWLEFAATKIRINEDGKPTVSSGDLTYYDVIYGDGFSYEIDYTAPFGSRIASMTYNGEEVKADDVFTVVVNNYRYNGGGNYVNWLNAHGCEFKANDPDRIIYSTQFDMIQGEDLGQARSLLMDYIQKAGKITPTITSTWKLIEPEDQIVIYYTNDVHTYIDGAISYDNLADLKAQTALWADGVLLLDAGDHVQGTAYGSMDKGKTIIELMNAAGYDAATLGNHEFDYGMERTLEIIEEADYPYLSCNFYHEDNGMATGGVLDGFHIFEVGGKKIAVVGVTTPESFTKSTPKYFQNEKGEYIYGISGGTDGKELYAAVQAAVDAAKRNGADYVIALGHCGDDPASKPWTSEEVIANTTGIDAFIDGHSHSTVPMKEVKDKDGETVVLTQTGSYFGAIGRLNITEDGINAQLIKEYTGAAPAVKEIKEKWISEIDTKLGEVIGHTDLTLDNYDEEGNRLVRKQETNTGDFAADALYYLFDNMELDVDLAVMNGGGVRNKAVTGDISYKTCKSIHTFGNVACLITVTGQQILDALEWGARDVGTAECGGFLQVSGVSYEIHTYIPSTVQKDEKGVWTGGPTGEYRVKNVMIGGEPLDLTKTYNLAGYNYTLRDLGDGFAMFDGAVNVLDYVMEDYMVLANYVKSFPEKDGVHEIEETNSVLGANYAEVTGEGRITVVAEKADEDEALITEVVDIEKYGNLDLKVTGSELLAFGLAYGDIITVEVNGKTYDMPVGTNYSDVDNGLPICRVVIDEENNKDYVVLAINMGDLATTAGIATKTKIEEDPGYRWDYNEGITTPVVVKITLKEAGGYYEEWLMRQLTRTNVREDYPDLSDAEFANFRVIATKGMGENILYRSSSPVNPELGRNTYADAAMREAGVKTVMNLADTEAGMKAYEGYEDSYYATAKVIPLNLGVDFTAPEFKAGLKEGFLFIASNEGPYLIHCNEGKDRAGFVSALLECLMGATADEVIADYMVTYYNYYGVKPDTEQYQAIAKSNIMKSLATAFDIADITAEDVDLAAEAEAFLKEEVGMTEEEIAALKASLGKSNGTNFENKFTDVKEDEWYYDYVIKMAAAGVVNGMTETTFEPEGHLTRGQMVVMLYRVAGEPEVEGYSTFIDVPKDEYYAKAVAWAQKEGVVNGTSEKTFEPEENVTREQMITMFHRIEEKEAGTGDLSKFKDANKVAEYAVEAMKWAVGKGIINGTTIEGDKNLYLDPQGLTTRAQAAKVFCIWMDLYVAE